MTLLENLGAFLRETLPVVQELDADPERWDQRVGDYSETCPCCIGAHLAHHFKVSSTAVRMGEPKPAWAVPLDWKPDSDWRRGFVASARSIDCDESQFLLLLRAAGAPLYPFGPNPWPLPPPQVWANLGQITELPPESDHLAAERWLERYHTQFGITCT